MSENERTRQREDARRRAEDEPRVTSHKPRATSDNSGPEIAERMCANCTYARWMRPGPSALLGAWFGHWVCTNHPDSGGDMREVHPMSACRNFRFCRRPVERGEPPEPDGPGVKHIALTRNKYRATAWKNGKSVYVGRYDDEIEAARAADRKNYEFNGEFAYLNFPDELHRNLATEDTEDTEKKGKGKEAQTKGKARKAKKAAKRKPGRKPRRRRGGSM